MLSVCIILFSGDWIQIACPRKKVRANIGNLYALRDHLAGREKAKVVTRDAEAEEPKPLVTVFKRFVPAKAPVRVILAANPSADWERIFETASSFDDVKLLLGSSAIRGALLLLAVSLNDAASD